jgi:octaprenyl-diphosphate synthase
LTARTCYTIVSKEFETLEKADPVVLSAPDAVAALSAATDDERSDPRLRQRLVAVQELLADELAWVERALVESASAGPDPAAQAARHLVSHGGKRIRPLALLLSAACFGPVPPVARELALVAELVHSATLLHDDVVDEGLERRGVPTARRLWGNGVSVLAGDLLLVHALSTTLERAPQIMPDLVLTLRRLVDGEIVQLRGRRELDLSEETYERVLRDKTASLFAWATCTGARVAGAHEADQRRMASFGERLGIAFQLVDDVLDYAGEQTGKTLLADLREGKLTLPLVLAVVRRPELVEPLRKIHAGDAAPVAEVSRAVIESGACEAVRQRAERQTTAAIAALESLMPSPARSLLVAVAQELGRRAA